MFFLLLGPCWHTVKWVLHVSLFLLLDSTECIRSSTCDSETDGREANAPISKLCTLIAGGRRRRRRAGGYSELEKLHFNRSYQVSVLSECHIVSMLLCELTSWNKCCRMDCTWLRCREPAKTSGRWQVLPPAFIFWGGVLHHPIDIINVFLVFQESLVYTEVVKMWVKAIVFLLDISCYFEILEALLLKRMQLYIVLWHLA